MKKKIGFAAGLLGILLVVIAGVLKMKKNTAIAVIGGADGPTSIYLAGRLSGNVMTGAIVAGIILIVTAIMVMLKKRH